MDYIHLSGSEEVGRAGYRMTDAADTMSRAANNFDSTCDRMLQGLEQLVQRLEAAAEKMTSTEDKKFPAYSSEIAYKAGIDYDYSIR